MRDKNNLILDSNSYHAHSARISSGNVYLVIVWYTSTQSWNFQYNSLKQMQFFNQHNRLKNIGEPRPTGTIIQKLCQHEITRNKYTTRRISNCSTSVQEKKIRAEHRDAWPSQLYSLVESITLYMSDNTIKQSKWYFC